MSQMQILKAAIKTQTEALICQTHPQVCALRDQNYARLEQLLLSEIFSNKYAQAPSIQTAIASLEIEL